MQQCFCSGVNPRTASLQMSLSLQWWTQISATCLGHWSKWWDWGTEEPLQHWACTLSSFAIYLTYVFFLCFFQLRVEIPDKPGATVNFRKLLLNRCQKEFEKDKDDDEIFEKKQKELEAASGVCMLHCEVLFVQRKSCVKSIVKHLKGSRDPSNCTCFECLFLCLFPRRRRSSGSLRS